MESGGGMEELFDFDVGCYQGGGELTCIICLE